MNTYYAVFEVKHPNENGAGWRIDFVGVSDGK